MASAQYSITIAQPGCEETWGDVEIPYPFGMKDPKFYASKWFEIECKNSSQGEKKPYLKYINLEVTYFDIIDSTVSIMNPIHRRNCRSKDVGSFVELRGGPFVYSQLQNKFLAVGCNKIAFLVSNGSPVSGCVSICDDNVHNVTIEDLSKSKKNVSDQCSLALIGYYQDHNPSIGELKHVKHVPAVVEWEIPNNETLKLPVDEFSNCDATNVTSSQSRNSGHTYSCIDGFDVNPYIAGSCKDMIPTTTLIIPLM